MMESTDATEKRRLSDTVAKHASLIDLRVRELDAKILEFDWKPPFDPKISIRPNAGRSDDVAVYDFEYSLEATDKSEKPVFRARLVMTLVFRLSDGAELETEGLEAFGSLGVVEIAHPYVREIVHSLTFRMGLPPFVLDVAPPIVPRRSARI